MPQSYALTDKIFFEDFDGDLTGWNESLCIRNDPSNQICRLGQYPNASSSDIIPNSAPYWGFVEIQDVSPGGGSGPVEVRYQKNFNVLNEGNYNVTAWLAVSDCSGCHESTQLFIDDTLIMKRTGSNLDYEPPGQPTFFEQKILHLTPGTHNIEMSMYSTTAIYSHFRAYFDDITISVATLDIDGDAIPDFLDNCPSVANTRQYDRDSDGLGDACDNDIDNDTILNNKDNCALVANLDQKNTDGDSKGNACDLDDDNDGIVDKIDNCQFIVNLDQINTDGDKRGDACDAYPDDPTK